MPSQRNRASRTRRATDEVSAQPSAPLVNADFVISLCLEQRRVHTTKVLFVKSDESAVWKGWDAARLLRFLRTRAALNLPAQSVIETGSLATALRRFMHGLEEEMRLLQQPDAANGFELRLNPDKSLVLHSGERQYAIAKPIALENALGADLLLDLARLVCQNVQATPSAIVEAAEAATEEIPAPLANVRLQQFELWPAQTDPPSAGSYALLPRNAAWQAVLSFEWDAVKLPLPYCIRLTAQHIDQSERHLLMQSNGEFSDAATLLTLPIAHHWQLTGVYRIEAQFETESATTRKSRWLQVY